MHKFRHNLKARKGWFDSAKKAAGDLFSKGKDLVDKLGSKKKEAEKAAAVAGSKDAAKAAAEK